VKLRYTLFEEAQQTPVPDAPDDHAGIYAFTVRSPSSASCSGRHANAAMALYLQHSGIIGVCGIVISGIRRDLISNLIKQEEQAAR
jgi:hypothetical protein